MFTEIRESLKLGMFRHLRKEFMMIFFCLYASVHASTLWPDPVSNDVIPYGVSALTNGPVLGAPAANSMRIWVRTKQPVSFRIVYSQTLPLTPSSRGVEGETRTEMDNTGYVELTNLQAHLRYYYGVVIRGQLIDTRLDFHDPWPSFMTLPDMNLCADPDNNPKGLFNLCFSVGHCASQEREPSLEYGDPISFHTLLNKHKEEIMFHIMNGDTIYEELRDGTLDGIRANYRLYWKRGRGFSKLRRYVPMLYTYDDHEIGDNLFGSGYVGFGRGPCLMRDIGLKAWTEYCDWANYPSPYRGNLVFGKAVVKKNDDILYDPHVDFSKLRPETVSTIHVGIYTKGGPKPKWPENAGVYGLEKIIDKHHLRLKPAFKASEEINYSIGTHFYFDWQIANCHFFALDMRGERGPYHSKHLDDPQTFLLGTAQKKWFLEKIQSSKADFIFVISPDPWVIHHTAFHVLLLQDPELINDPPPGAMVPKGDGFSSYLAEREFLIDALDKINKPIVIITGDVHNAMSVKITDNLWEILAGPMGSSRHPIGTCGNMPLGGKWDSLGRQVVVKWAAPSPNNVLYTHNRNTYYVVIQVNNVMKTASPKVPGQQWFAYDTPNVLIRFHDGYTGKLVYVESISLADFSPDAIRVQKKL